MGRNKLDAFDAVTESGNVANNYAVNAGIVLPFGSQHFQPVEHSPTQLHVIERYQPNYQWSKHVQI